MPNRRTDVTRDVLAKWLTTELHGFNGCEECVVRGVYRLEEPDEEGCNWSMDGVPVGATGVPAELLRRALVNVMKRARERFNVLPQ